MPAGPDFDAVEPEGESRADIEDLLELGGGSPRWLRRLGAKWAALRYGTPLLLCAALAVGGLVAWTTVGHSPSPTAAPSTRLGRTPRPAFNSAPLLTVRGLAHHEGPLIGYVRQSTPVGACTLVKPGHSPLPLIGRAIHRIAPHYRVVDSAMVLDQFTGLCAIQLRARNKLGDVLVVSIASPPGHTRHAPYDRVETGFESGPRSTTYALDVSRTGFRILVGATGPERGLPLSTDLARLASARALTW